MYYFKISFTSLTVILSVAISKLTYAQQGMGVGNNNPQEMLDVSGAIKVGTTTTTNAGTIRWTGTEFQGWDGTQWTTFGAGSDGDWTLTGTDLFNNTEEIGIGTNAPNSRLHVELANGDFKLFDNAGNSGVVILGRLQGANGNNPQLRINGSGGSSDIGQDAAGNFVIERNDVARVAIDASGNVGVGIATPANFLDVANGTRTGTHPTGLPLYVTGAMGANANGVEFRHNNGSQGIGFGFNTIYAAGSAANQSLTIAPKGTGLAILDGPSRFQGNMNTTNNWISGDGDDEGLYIGDDGFAGVGTNSPTVPFEIRMNNNAGQLLVTPSSTNGQDAAIVIRGAKSASNVAMHAQLNFENFDNDLGTPNTLGSIVGRVTNFNNNTGDLAFYNSANGSTLTETMRLTKNSNVGIGTSDPQDKFHVEGSIRMVDGNEQVGYIPVSDANGTMTWTDPTGISGSVGEIVDADNDTKIQVEESADEDIIRFDVSGTEALVISKNVNGNILIETPHNASDNLSIGYEAGLVNTDSYNTFVGNESGKANTTGTWNAFFGRRSGVANTTGDANTFVGNIAGVSNTTGGFNTIVGQWAGGSMTTSGGNTMVGANAGQNATGNQNTFIGTATGVNAGAGVKNVHLGWSAGQSAAGSENVFIGYRSGQNESGSSKLYIENSNSTSPLIYGEFDNDLLRVNGTLNINNAYDLPTADGTNGFVMTTDGSGAVSWTDPTTISSAVSGELADVDNDTKIQVEENADEDFIRFDTGGQERMVVNQNGNVGIGETNPSALLHLKTSANDNTGGLRFSSSGANAVIHLNANSDLVLGKLNVPDQLVLNNNGGVGIGTNAPTEELQVEGSIRMVDGNQATGYVPVSNANGTMTWTDPTTISTSNDGDWTISGNDMYSGNSGNVGVGINSPQYNMHVHENSSAESLTLYTNSTTGNTIDDGLFVGIVSNEDAKIKLQENSHLILGTNDIDRVWIMNDGKVGIGTSAINNNAQVQIDQETSSAGGITTVLVIEADDDDNDYNLLAGSGPRVQFRVPIQSGSAIGASIDAVRSNATDAESNTDLVFRTSENNTNLQSRMIIKDNGRIGIGTSAPDQGFVVIADYFNYNEVNSVGVGQDNLGGYILEEFNGDDDYSLYAYGAISTAQILVRSDVRIKDVIGISDGASDLKTLNQIEITDYVHKDRIKYSGRPVKKVIAQQVASIYPQAVNKNDVSVIPDIMKFSTINSGKVMMNDHGLNEGDKVQLAFGKDRVMANVISVEGGSFLVDCEREGEVFVYGRQVNDFHQVDYDALSMLNISATQELARLNVLLTKRVADLESQLQTENSTNKARIERLEELLQVGFEAKR